MTAPIIALRGVSKQFGPTQDSATRLTRAIATRLGAVARNQTVRAVEQVDRIIAERAPHGASPAALPG